MQRLQLAALALAIALLCAGAGPADAKSSPSATTTVKATISGTGTAPSSANIGSDGQCVDTGYPWVDDYTCSGAGNCECVTLTSPKSPAAG